MKKLVIGFLLGVIVGAASVAGYFYYERRAYLRSSVCFSCFWQGQSAALRTDLIEFYRQYKSPDDFVMADVSYILWRAVDQPNCDAREQYLQIANSDPDAYRRFMARSIYAFGGPECGQEPFTDYGTAGDLAAKLGLGGESDMLGRLGRREFTPSFEDVAITSKLEIPNHPKTMILGETRIVISAGTRVGTQVDRVARDWLSYQMRWDLSGAPMPTKDLISYHEGAVVTRIVKASAAEVYPLTGTLIAKRSDKWYAPDEKGVFRFQVLEDKVEYPTTHVAGQFGIIEDTHGVSALVSQALERHMSVVVACGDSDGKAKAAFYLAQRGVNVIMPGDRYIDELIGYEGTGVVMGTSPVRQVGDKAVVGGQPIRFLTRETIVVEDTKKNFPLQYYDAGARYFRHLAKLTPLQLEFVMVDDQGEIERVLSHADEISATAVAVRVVNKVEHDKLEAWLKQSPQRRAVLFHSGLYPFAQPLFEEFPQQVTFGDLRPRFE
ncbi:MAG: hypothetical protein M3P27_00355 [Acidobacteriota bacterium]|nr:hypothetical protein [Acidobacteriota bacterium]